jgi:hypothetical protein
MILALLGEYSVLNLRNCLIDQLALQMVKHLPVVHKPSVTEYTPLLSGTETP